jgi:hypothetical protein
MLTTIRFMFVSKIGPRVHAAFQSEPPYARVPFSSIDFGESDSHAKTRIGGDLPLETALRP